MTNLAPLLAALIAVESGGDCRAIGDSGRARGILQIHPGVVQDVNRIAGTHYRHRDAHDPKVAVWMAETYLRHYCPGASAERMARTWHCGPSGWRRAHGAKYWRKVQKNLQNGSPRRATVVRGVTPQENSVLTVPSRTRAHGAPANFGPSGVESRHATAQTTQRVDASCGALHSRSSARPGSFDFPRRQPERGDASRLSGSRMSVRSRRGINLR